MILYAYIAIGKRVKREPPTPFFYNIEVTSLGNLTSTKTLNHAQNSVSDPGWIIEKGYLFFEKKYIIINLHKN